MIKILHVLYAASGGGIESMLYSYFVNMNRDGLKLDLAVCTEPVCDMEAKFEQLGCRVFHLPRRSDNLKKHCRALEKLIKEEKYDIVHSHQNENAFITLSVAKKCGVPVRISHCHNAYPHENAVQYARRALSGAADKFFATHLFACSGEAAEWLYGKKADVTIVKNAMELSKFSFDESVRKEVRDEFGFDGKNVIGCVGRLEEQKNHAFLLDIFKALSEKSPDSVLLVIGDGALRKIIEEKAERLGITQKVIFLGIRRDVPRLMCAMDAFVLPSLFEGLGIVFVESQASGLPTFCNDIKGVQSACVTPLIHPMKQGTSADEWADTILENIGKGERSGYIEKIAESGFEITDQAPVLESFYREALL